MREIIRRVLCLGLAVLMVLSTAAFCFAEEDVSVPARTYAIDGDYSAGSYNYDNHEMVVTFTGQITKTEAETFGEEYGMMAMWPYSNPAFTDVKVVYKLDEEASLGEMIMRVLNDDRVQYATPNAPVVTYPTGGGPVPGDFHVPYYDYSYLTPGVDYVDGEVIVTFDLAVPDIPYAFKVMEDHGCVITDILSFDESFSAGKTVLAKIVNGKTVLEVLYEIHDAPFILYASPNGCFSIDSGNNPVPPDDPQEPAEITVTRIAGKDRIKTAFEVAKLIGSSGKLGEHTVVCDGRDYPDALSGSAFSKGEGKVLPILLSTPGREEEVCKFINDNTGNRVYIIGGEAAVPKKFEEVAKHIGTPGIYSIDRLSGSDRYDTNLKVLHMGCSNANGNVIVASGKNYADALSASATDLPILLVGDVLTKEQKAWLKEYAVGICYIVGGEGAVSREIEEEIRTCLFGSKVVRLAGKDRYATSWKIADVFFVGADTAILARGDDFADALSAGALAYSLHAPILLVDKFENHGMARNFVFGSWAQVTNVYVMGGEGAISDKVVQWVIDPSLY